MNKFTRKVLAGLFAGALIGSAAAPVARAADCVSVNVVVLGQTVAACVPVSDLPTVRVTVPGPRVTVNVPGGTETVNVPGPVRTVTRNVNVPGPTVTRQAPGPTVTRNSTATATRNTRSTATTTSSSAPDTTRTASNGGETVTKTEREVVTITKTKAIGYSLLFAGLGALLALLIVGFLAYRLGWRLGDNGNRAFLDELRKEKRKH